MRRREEEDQEMASPSCSNTSSQLQEQRDHSQDSSAIISHIPLHPPAPSTSPTLTLTLTSDPATTATDQQQSKQPSSCSSSSSSSSSSPSSSSSCSITSQHLRHSNPVVAAVPIPIKPICEPTTTTTTTTPDSPASTAPRSHHQHRIIAIDTSPHPPTLIIHPPHSHPHPHQPLPHQLHQPTALSASPHHHNSNNSHSHNNSNNPHHSSVALPRPPSALPQSIPRRHRSSLISLSKKLSAVLFPPRTHSSCSTHSLHPPPSHNIPQPAQLTINMHSHPPPFHLQNSENTSHTLPTNIPFNASSPDIQSPNASASIIKSHRHSFWSGLGVKDRSNSRKNSSVTLATYPNQRIYKSATLDNIPRQPSLLGPSRVIAVVGNIRRGIGRMILEELVSQKFIVVALIEKADGDFSRSVELLASSPSLFHAFVVEGGLFGQAMAGEVDELVKVNQILPQPTEITTRSTRAKSFRSFRLGKKGGSKKSVTPSQSATDSLGDSSITELSSHNSFLSNKTSSMDSARLRTIVELKNIFQAYRVDTVICSFEPQVLDQPAGPRARARVEDEKQFGLPPAAERARIERMERTVLEASLASGAVGRFAVTVHPTSLGPCVLSPNPTSSIRPHLLSALVEHSPLSSSHPDHLPISITEFRWGFLMNDLAFDDSLVDGVTAENGLGKWLCEPPSSRSVIDLERRRCLIPAARITSRRETTKKKGKHKLEPVCMTLAEDVSRFIGLACRLRDQWEWKTGKMVGDCVPGGWEEAMETIERISRKKLERQYICVGTMVNGYASDSGSSNSSLEQQQQQQKQSSNVDLVDLSGMVSRVSIEEEVYRFQDTLRGTLVKENLDASSVRLREFVRVWYTPLQQPPSIVVDGNRLRKKTSFRDPLKKNLSPPSSSSPNVGPLKPQVAENGTLQPAGARAKEMMHHHKHGRKNENQFLSVPSAATKQPAAARAGALPAASTRSPPLARDTQPAITNSTTTSSSQEFNFVPQVIVPFNTAAGTTVAGPCSPPNHNHKAVAPISPLASGPALSPLNFQQPYQPPQQPAYPPAADPRAFPFPGQLRPAPSPAAAPSAGALSSNGRNPRPAHNDSLANDSHHHLHHPHRILPRSPLAARVA